MKYLTFFILGAILSGCGQPCEPSFTPFKPNFCMQMSDVSELDGVVRIPEDVLIYELSKDDTTVGFHGWFDEEFIIWQTWEFPVDSTGPDYLEKYFEWKFHIVESQCGEPLEKQAFHVQDHNTNLYYRCSVSKKNNRKMLFVIFEFPDFRVRE